MIRLLLPLIASFAPSGVLSRAQKGTTAGTGDAALGPSPCCQLLASVNFTSNLPVIIIDTNKQYISPAFNATTVEAKICTCSMTDHFPDFQGMAGVRVHGSTTRKQYFKKSYGIDLQEFNSSDSKTSSVKFPFVGLPEGASWILYGPENDADMGLRNWLAYDSWRAIDPNIWGPRSRFVEVFLNDKGGPLQAADYHGIYLVLERIERDPNRLNLTRLDTSTDPSGGYIWSYENDNIKPTDVTFNSSFSGLEFPFVYPSKPDQVAINWLKTYFEHFEEATLSPQFMNPASGYRAFVNESLAVNYFLLIELTKSPDGYRGSTYMYKDAGPNSRFGFVPWDFNEAFGMCCGYPIEGYQNGGQSTGLSGGSAISPNGWRFNICAEPSRCLVDPTDGISRYFRRFWEDPEFRVAVAQQYKKLRMGPWSQSTILQNLSDKATYIRAAALRDYQYYRSIMVDPRYFSSCEQRWDYEVKNLYDWMGSRLTWMDSELAKVGAAAQAEISAQRPLVS